MKSLEKLPSLTRENPYQQKREQEILDFIKSRYPVAELECFSPVTVGREVELYKKAVRQLRFKHKDKAKQLDHIVICIRKHKPHAIYDRWYVQEQRSEELPTIEIVRCKDCKHWQPQEYGVVEMPYCKFLGEREEIGLSIKLGNPDDFCSYGERIDNV